MGNIQMQPYKTSNQLHQIYNKFYDDVQDQTDNLFDFCNQTSVAPHEGFISNFTNQTLTPPKIQVQQNTTRQNENDQENIYPQDIPQASRHEKKDNVSMKNISSKTKKYTQYFLNIKINIRYPISNRMFILYYWSELQRRGLLTKEYVRYIMRQYQNLIKKIQQQEIDIRKAFGEQQIRDIRQYQKTLILLQSHERLEVVAKTLYNYSQMRHKRKFKQSFENIKKFRQENGLSSQ